MTVVKVTSPEEASQANGTKLQPSGLLRGEQRAELPPHVTIHSTKDGAEIHVPRPGIFVYALEPGETVVRDKESRIVAVKGGEGRTVHETKFVPGTAEQIGNEVHGELEDHEEHEPLFPGDRVELRGTFAPGETVPLGGKVELVRAWSALAFGGAMLGGAYLPSIILAATSPVDANHWLYVPVIGPWIAYVARDGCQTSATDPTSCFADSATRIALIFDGISQTAGLLLLVVGLPTWADVTWGKQAKVRVGPLFGKLGLSVSGTF